MNHYDAIFEKHGSTRCQRPGYRYDKKGNQIPIVVKLISKEGAVAQYEDVDRPGVVFAPLIVDGQNVDRYTILEEEASHEI